MSEAKHTPGPWWFDDRRSKPANAGGGDVLILGKHRGEGSSFCVASLNHQFEIGSVLPNARLLAAAPDLYEALRLLVADVAQYEAWRRPCHALDVAQAALTKALPPQEQASGDTDRG